ncbi:EF-hand domain-containing protein [Caulobacter sp. RHG1]|uniref:EF-hand domain-containing protein n=1 Tax=Caulobacter sp. (strain RHG1) TaxID=2545762 RepID=UPI001555BB3D|nr:EF-hand domain-containing protein [Caulobacter sp. RHG1]NQE62987.1 EF hand domain protein [Caulobacter sp. RHG1]
MRRTLLVALGAVGVLTAGTATAQEGPPPPRRMPAPEEVFKSWDTNADGVVDKAEWVAAKRPEDRFAMIDADKDGKITLDEMKTAFETMRQRRMRQDGEGPPPPPEAN